MIANHEDFSIKKALRCGAEATVFFILCCAIYTVGQMKHQYEGALQCVSFVTYVVLYFYALNILKNLKKIFKPGTTPWQIVSFLYYILRFKFIERIPWGGYKPSQIQKNAPIERIPGLSEYLNIAERQTN